MMGSVSVRVVFRTFSNTCNGTFFAKAIHVPYFLIWGHFFVKKLHRGCLTCLS